MNRPFTRYFLVASSLLVLIAVTTRGADVPAAKPKANYELASHWTAHKVGKLVFDLIRDAALARGRPLLVCLRKLRRPQVLPGGSGEEVEVAGL